MGPKVLDLNELNRDGLIDVMHASLIGLKLFYLTVSLRWMEKSS